mmetsp:Transcript_166479/g.404553  ORF Transcript_166479/g.404553 Transcript_166479/m.404553 type:complete len:300 (-) Transcript_166479:67-966(-)
MVLAYKPSTMGNRPSSSQFHAGRATPALWQEARHTLRVRGCFIILTLRHAGVLGCGEPLDLSSRRLLPQLGVVEHGPGVEGKHHDHQCKVDGAVARQQPCRQASGLGTLWCQGLQWLGGNCCRAEVLVEKLGELLGVGGAAANPGGDALAPLVVVHRGVLLHALLVAEDLVHGAVHHPEAHNVAQEAALVQPLAVLLSEAHVGRKRFLARFEPINAEENHPMVDVGSFEHVAAERPAVQRNHGAKAAGADDRLLLRCGHGGAEDGGQRADPDRRFRRHDGYGVRTKGERGCVRPDQYVF